jgi:hypothetical protein
MEDISLDFSEITHLNVELPENLRSDRLYQKTELITNGRVTDRLETLDRR